MAEPLITEVAVPGDATHELMVVTIPGEFHRRLRGDYEARITLDDRERHGLDEPESQYLDGLLHAAGVSCLQVTRNSVSVRISANADQKMLHGLLGGVTSRLECDISAL